uniref:Putative transcriptional regulator n=1 Tax=termite gut metagenome TaxID=433724 RepID=S0DG10_9ZZZZ
MSVTTHDIARECNVSRGTVDRALNARSGVSEKTRQLVLKKAEEMGYRPHQLARALVKGKTMSIGVIVFDLYNSFFASLLNSIESMAKELGFFVNITLTNKDPAREIECIEHLMNGRVDGLIICPVNRGEEFAKYIRTLSIPVVTVLNALEDDHIPYVGINQFRAMYEATQYVISKGYGRTIFFCPPIANRDRMNVYSQEQRYLGYLEAVSNSETPVESTVFTKSAYQDLIPLIMDSSSKKTAVICSSDIFALNLINHLKLRGVNVPYKVGVMGFDNIDENKYVIPALSTVSIPIQQLGEVAASVLIQKINQEDTLTEGPPFHFLNYDIIPGQTII